MQTPQPPKGTRDFYPQDMAVREFIFKSWEKTCRTYGFESYDGPMFEHLELYSQKSGDEIEKQLYAFEDKGGRRIALRPELTPTLARMVAARGTTLKRPVRWYSIPALFRYERMQRGRLRQFFQLNMDILGVAEVSADADLIAAVVGMMTDLGFTAADFSVRVSSRNLIHQLFVANGLSENMIGPVLAILDKRHKIPPEEFRRELDEVIGNESLMQRTIDLFNTQMIHDLEKSYPEMPAVKELVDLFAMIKAYGIEPFVQFDIGIVRGLAYYTGIVFEVFDARRSLRAIAGGGRYDKLVKLYGGPDTPAVGFAAGDVVLGELLAERGIIPALSPRCQVYVVAFEDAWPQRAIQLTQLIRAGGISAEYSLVPGGVGKQLKHANASAAPLVLFAGGDEEREGKLRIKDMVAGTETLIDESSLIATLAAMSAPRQF